MTKKHDNGSDTIFYGEYDTGLTKREFFAAIAMHAMLGDDIAAPVEAIGSAIELTAACSVRLADALLTELARAAK